jgi:DeoR/GlpR family transcriptional regulator of sugar metabolism
MDSNLPSGRREVVARRLHDGHAVVATDLAKEFDISEDAIRRDLRALASEGRCTRVYGGALPLSTASTSIEVRSKENQDRKRALAAVAVTLIKPDELVFIDSGSTNLALAGMLSQCKGISVATNSVTIAAALLAHRIPLVMVGGAVNPDVGGCVDTAAVRAVQQLNVDRCFLGTCAVSLAEGVGAFGADDAAFKRALLEVSRKTVVLVTNEKLETRARYRVAPLKRINTLVVEHDAAIAAPKLIAKAASIIVTASAER